MNNSSQTYQKVYSFEFAVSFGNIMINDKLKILKGVDNTRVNIIKPLKKSSKCYTLANKFRYRLYENVPSKFWKV